MAFPMKLMCQGGWGICPVCSTDKIKMSWFLKLLWFQAAEYDLRQKWTGLRVHRNSLPQSIHTWSPLPRSRHGAYPVSQRSLPYASKVTAVHTITIGRCCLLRRNHYALLPAFLWDWCQWLWVAAVTEGSVYVFLCDQSVLSWLMDEEVAPCIGYCKECW